MVFVIMVTSQQSHPKLAVMKKLRSSQEGPLFTTLSSLVTTSSLCACSDDSTS